MPGRVRLEEVRTIEERKLGRAGLEEEWLGRKMPSWRSWVRAGMVGIEKD